ncbi:MAG: SagB/ThcOx family dehydrogenase [Fervidobacterium sp.]|nr:SagB/ThcOx family dehydrogenase [Fervidobacterium sp.]
MSDNDLIRNREFLKSNWEVLKSYVTDQKKGVPIPPFEKPYPEDAELIDLPFAKNLGKRNVSEVIEHRVSHRKYLDIPLSIEELSFLLWATQGVRGKTEKVTFRTVPSAGSRHPFETYVYARNVESLDEAVYRYLPLEHKLLLHKKGTKLAEQIIKATLDQNFVGEGAAVFIWTAIPYRTEWRYGPAAHKAILLDAGHVCQNLYIACESIDAGTCAIAAYSQRLMDEFVGVDGIDEFVIYLAPVGKVK